MKRGRLVNPIYGGTRTSDDARVPVSGTLFWVNLQRGFTLVELAIVAGIVAMLALGAAFALGNKPYALRSSVTLLNSTLAQARAIAESSGNGATLTAVPRGGGTVLYLYRGRPNDPANMLQAGPPIEVQAALSETNLGAAPFSLFMDGGGHVTGLGGYPAIQNGEPAAFTSLATPPPCPSPGLIISVAAGATSEPVTLACAGSSS